MKLSCMLTDYHAKYYAYELSKRCPSDSVEKFASSLLDAQVDLNPHQVDAALFAFRSPLSSGAILADEVGLGKTIEAGIILSQKWAERKRRILIIVPSSLRKQWNQELIDKFFLPSIILESKVFNKLLKEGIKNPFQQDGIVICSYHFAQSKASFMNQIKWDIVVIDEAHRLRNVYKKSNKIARALKDALYNTPKLLLTATPLQNSLLELFGLVSFIDDYTFGDVKSFKNQFSRLSNDSNFNDLKARLKPICKRTLRRQVVEYIKYTNRIPITKEFIPTEEEQILYEMVSEYLRRHNLQALPSSQRSLMTLVMRKLLASSTFAIAGTLERLERKLTQKLKKAGKAKEVENDFEDDFENLEEIMEEWEDFEDIQDFEESLSLNKIDIETIEDEIEELKAFKEIAFSITENAKGNALVSALHTAFNKAEELGASKKAVIFTESRRTQNYLYNLLSKEEYAEKIILFNGSNNDEKSKQIYKEWHEKYKNTDKVSGSKAVDIRQALTDYFRNEAQIMIATEAAAEGINLQFCSLVVNYDLPWNPQRVEQRIGRCHRYGQKFDVVVVNFLNKNNAADQRVYELLEEKFQLFSGVFGASDEVLGVIESGVDFEKRILEIYQQCRTNQEIQLSFGILQKELEAHIDENMKAARNKLLENFDEEVHEKLRVRQEESKLYLNKYEKYLWELTKYYLEPYADFIPEKTAFQLKKNPFSNAHIPLLLYKIGQKGEDSSVYRIGHPLAQLILQKARNTKLSPAEILFDYSGSSKKISILEPLKGKTGYLSLTLFTVKAFETEDYLVFSAVTQEGKVLEDEAVRRFFSLPGKVLNINIPIDSSSKLIEFYRLKEAEITENIAARNSVFFDEEMDKLDSWADDMKNSLKTELKELDEEIKELRKQARISANLPEKLALRKKVKNIEKKREKAWKEYDSKAGEVETKKDELLDNIEQRLDQHLTKNDLFAIKWKII